jgi:hypothetical protein
VFTQGEKIAFAPNHLSPPCLADWVFLTIDVFSLCRQQ